MASLGMIFPPSFPPERLRDVARAAEAAELDELWVFEDCFKESGLATLVAALAATERIRVGVGILPMPLRNVAVTAMEFATIERLFPGRARFGVGHGVQEWMGQVGARAASPLTLMREYVPALRALLAGQEVTVSGRCVRLDRVKLDWPPAGRVPVLAAGEGPKTVALTGEVADGIVVDSRYGAGQVRETIARSRDAFAAAGRRGEFEPVAFLRAEFGEDASRVVEAEFDAMGLTGERRSAAAGSEASVAATAAELFDAGAGTVLLQSRADEPDLEGYAERAGGVAALLRE